MKKIYSFIAVAALSLTAAAQSGDPSLGKMKMKPSTRFTQQPKAIKNYKAAGTAGGPVQMRVDPMAALYLSNFGDNTSIRTFYTSLFCDSLVKLEDSYVTTHMNGIIFDPKSISQGINGTTPTFAPIFTKYDSYTIDTIWIGGMYNRISPATVKDTLMIDVVWGDTSTTSVFSRYAFPAANAPLDKFGTMITPKFTVTAPVTSHGYRAKFAAPAANRMLYKAALVESDSTVINSTGYYGYKLASPLTIPANNVVCVGYTFVSGMTYTLGDVYFSLDQATYPQTINGFAPYLYSQYPQPTSTSAIGDFFNDYAPGKNQSVVMYDNQRYGTIGTGYIQTTALYNQFSSGYWIDLSIHGMSTVGVSELESKGFELSQNVPNPYTGETSISYELAKGARNVKFTVYDVSGRVMIESLEPSTIGVHAIRVPAFASGVYYYSLNVDGAVTTKKMIAQ